MSGPVEQLQEPSTIIEGLQWFGARVLEYSFGAFSSWDRFWAAIDEIRGMFTSLSSGFAWPYLLASLAIAMTAFALAKRRESPMPASLQEFLFPRRVYRHPSALLDYRFYMVNTLLTVLLWGPILVGVGLLAQKIVKGLLIGYVSWNPPSTLPAAALFAVVLGFYLLQDFAGYWAHLACHKIPVLWAFHKVHHSADVLTPVSAYRAHPIEFFIFALPKAPIAALATVFYQNISPHDLEVTTAFGVSIVALVYGMSGFHLQHSHLPISYGPVMNRFVISPILHQIHHSNDPRHLDRNFGIKFSLWDWLFGTLYLPERPETVRVGIHDREFRQFRSVAELFSRPCVEAVGHFRYIHKAVGSSAPVLER